MGQSGGQVDVGWGRPWETSEILGAESDLEMRSVEGAECGHQMANYWCIVSNKTIGVSWLPCSLGLCLSVCLSVC